MGCIGPIWMTDPGGGTFIWLEWEYMEGAYTLGAYMLDTPAVAAFPASYNALGQQHFSGQQGQLT